GRALHLVRIHVVQLPGVRTIFPWTCRDSSSSWASRIWDIGITRSTTGRYTPEAIFARIAGNALRGPIVDPSTDWFLMKRCGSWIETTGPVVPPHVTRRPLRASTRI